MSEWNENKLLLADDEDLFRDTTALLLHKAGYAVDCAHDAAEAVRMLSAGRYDAIISDINMPGNAELQLVLEAHQIDEGLPVILVTGYPAVDTAVNAVKMAVIGYLIKPLDSQELLALIHKAVAKNRLYRTAADLRTQLASWDGDLKLLEESLHTPGDAELAGPTRLLLTTVFEIVTKSLVDMRRAAELLAVTNRSMRPNEVETLLNTWELVENALRQTIEVLEESKNVFKSKRLKELRQQLQGLVGLLTRTKHQRAALAAPPPHHLHRRVNSAAPEN